MYDAGKIIAGLVIFLLLITLPIWYNITTGKAAYVPDPKIISTEKFCVESTEYMRSNHMDLIYAWRDDVVRNGQRMFKDFKGRSHEMSLTKTCLNCHSNKAEFCDSCHNYMGVTPYCWDCHVDPETVRKEGR